MTDQEPQLSSQFLQSAYSVLRDRRRPMSARELTAAAMDDGYLDRGRLGGRTPHKTMQSKLSVHVRRHGDQSIFVNTAPGKYLLRIQLDSPEDEYEVPPFGARSPSEQVLVFDQSVLDSIGRFQGVNLDWKPYWEELVASSSCRSMDRMDAENSNDVKQVLTYILVRRSDDSLLCFDRGVVNRVDQMLRGRSCVGFGGHVRPVQPSLFDADDAVALFRNGAMELDEELRLPRKEAAELLSNPAGRLSVVGILNDDSSANGHRHFAFILEYQVAEDSAWLRPRGREKSINRVRWLDETTAEREHVHQFEYWSQLCLRHYAPSVASATPAFRVRRRRPLRRAKALVMAGQIASGKTEASRLMQAEFGFEQVNSGEVVAGILGLPPIPQTSRAQFQIAAEQFISSPSGPRDLAHALAREIRSRTGRVLLDGIRHLDTLDELRSVLGRDEIGVVFVHTPFDIALELYRAREDSEISALDFAARRSARVEQDVPRLIDEADAALYNWRGLEAYSTVVREFASSYLLTPSVEGD